MTVAFVLGFLGDLVQLKNKVSEFELAVLLSGPGNVIVELPESLSLLRSEVGDRNGVIPASLDREELLAGGAAGMSREAAGSGPAFFLEVHLQGLVVGAVQGVDLATQVKIRCAENQVLDVDDRLLDDDIVAIFFKLDVIASQLRELEDDAAASEDELLLDGALARGRVVLALYEVCGDRRVVADLLRKSPEVFAHIFIRLPKNGIERLFHAFHLTAESQNFENSGANEPLGGEFFQLSIAVAIKTFRELVGGPLQQSVILKLLCLLDRQRDWFVHLDG